MRYRRLGSTGTFVSSLSLGGMTFGAETSEAEAHGILDHYAEAGGTFLGTADTYQRGLSEEIIGRWLAGRGGGDDLVVATKVGLPMGEGANQAGLARPYLQRSLDASLRRLRLDCVDLYQAHCWDPVTPLEETLSAMDDFVRAGKVRYVGVSNFSGWQLQRAVLLARSRGWAPVSTLQPQYSLLSREIEWELTPLCADEGVGLLAWAPLGGGWLTAKYSPERRPAGATRLGEDPERGLEAYDRRNTPRTWDIVEVVRDVAQQRGGEVTPAQVALNWVTQRPGVSSAILGVRNLEQLRDNLSATTWQLTHDELARLDKVSDPGRPEYPYGFLDDVTEARRKRLEG